ncbi:MAG: hypothetical protein R3E66_23345 [bacterium]
MSNNNDYGLNWTVEEVNAFVSETYNRDVILSLILNYSVAHLHERCVLIVGTDTVQGHCASDWPGMPEQDVLRKIRSPLPADSSIHEDGIRIGAQHIWG